MIPTIPKIRASGKDSSISGPARTAMGLFQPGWRTTMQAIVAPAMPRNVAAILPYRIAQILAGSGGPPYPPEPEHVPDSVRESNA